MILAKAKTSLHDWLLSIGSGWDRFWFTPRMPHTLAILRIIAGLMLVYSHIVLATDLSSFLGDTAWINNETSRQLHDGTFGFSDWGRSYLWYISNPLLLWIHHGLTIAITASFAIGFLTRVTAPMALFLQLMYLHRLTGTLFGLDQIVTYSVMYLTIAPSGSLWSVDAWIRDKAKSKAKNPKWFAWMFPECEPTIASNIATRLLQIHLCVIYFFGGIAKARGTSWWDGTAIWYSVGNLEYQSVNMTWLANYPRLSSLMAHTTMFWELSYAAIVWPRITRPIALALALALHGGIALFLGMITFGCMMIAANLIFIEPSWWQKFAKSAGDQSDIALADDGSVDDAIADGSSDESIDEFEDLGDLEVDAIEDDFPSLSGSSLSGLSSANLSSLSAVGSENLQQREEAIKRREKRIREASDKINHRAGKLKAREAKYRDRVERLKQREAKIKDVVERAKQKRKK
ncbi:Sporulation-delaying protein SdpB [Rubripirellula amarantea]|uniref:Sporulation-delaying protein SdpB n=1 Tax=Rubripirellula amarantea TaxID=2527999 RepID=A0A5C5WQX2_9BACT|nr:HTTM domain-containing protein [Rubripirellula amarantea]TWT52937.1 Sporulation-delaying protein SdpB [Rubripirellula amarantea]